jgi:hypothetical protein
LREEHGMVRAFSWGQILTWYTSCPLIIHWINLSHMAMLNSEKAEKFRESLHPQKKEGKKLSGKLEFFS